MSIKNLITLIFAAILLAWSCLPAALAERNRGHGHREARAVHHDNYRRNQHGFNRHAVNQGHYYNHGRYYKYRNNGRYYNYYNNGNYYNYYHNGGYYNYFNNGAYFLYFMNGTYCNRYRNGVCIQ